MSITQKPKTTSAASIVHLQIQPHQRIANLDKVVSIEFLFIIKSDIQETTNKILYFREIY